MSIVALDIWPVDELAYVHSHTGLPQTANPMSFTGTIHIAASVHYGT